MHIHYIGPRLHPNFSDFLRELAVREAVSVLVATTFPNDDLDGIDYTVFPPSYWDKIRQRQFASDSKVQTFKYRKSSPSFMWLCRNLRRQEVDVILLRQDNRPLARKVRIAALCQNIKVFVFRQGMPSKRSPKRRHTVFALRNGASASGAGAHFVPLSISMSPKNSCVEQRNRGTQPQELRLVSVGKFVNRRGHNVVIDAFRLLGDRLEMSLDIFGGYSGLDAKGREALATLISESGLDEVIRLREPVSRSTLLSLYPTYDAYLYAGWSSNRKQSRRATFDRADGTNGTMLYSMIEAMSLGLPVVCSADQKVAGAVNHGQNGFLFRRRSPEDLADKLVMLSSSNLAAMSAESLRICQTHHDARVVANSFLAMAKQ